MAKKKDPFDKTALGRKDDAFDKRMGIKEDSPVDKKIDRLVQRNAKGGSGGKGKR